METTLEKNFTITFAKVGSVELVANSIEEAMQKASDVKDCEIFWSDDISITDVEEE